MSVLVLSSLDTTTSQGISSDRKRREMNSNHAYLSYLAEEDELGLILDHIPQHHYTEVEEVDPCTHLVAAYQKVGQILENKN